MGRARHESGSSVVWVLLLVGAGAAAGVVIWTLVEPAPLALGPLVVVPAATLLLVGSVNVVDRLPHHHRRISPTGPCAGLPDRDRRRTRRPGVGSPRGGGERAGHGRARRRRRTALGCPYPLESRGRVVACATPAEYRATALGDERFAAGLVLTALAVQLTVAVAPRELSPTGRL